MPSGNKGRLHLSATDKRVERVFPGVRGRLNAEITVDNGKGIVKLKKGAHVIIQPLNLDALNEEPQFKITCFSNNKASADASLPESQRDIVRGESYIYTTTDPSSYFRFDEHYERRAESLFPTPGSPALSEISQGQIPDCFLLASIQAILNHPDGPAFLRGMMVQNNDGTTTVRLFDPRTLEPVYKRISTAVIHDRSGSLSNHKALWVHVLESAYATMKTRSDGEVDASISSVFSEGGRSATATKILTGMDTRADDVGKKEASSWDTPKFLKAETVEMVELTLKAEEEFHIQQNTALYSLLTNELEQIVKMYKGSFPSVSLNALEVELSNAFIDVDNTVDMLTAYKEYKDYLLFYIKNKKACDAILGASAKQTDKLLKLLDLMGSDYMDGQHFVAQCINYISVPVEANIVREERAPFSGYYQESEYQQFRAIEKALADGCLVTASTPDRYGQAVPGLRNRHAYTVLKVVTRELRVVNPEGSESIRVVCFLQMRNPWGSTGRIYKQKGDTFEAVEAPEADIFEIELVDFNRYYTSIQISDSANNRFGYDRKMHELYKEVELAVAGLRLDSGASLSELHDFDIQYKYCVEKLFDLELTHLDEIDERLSKLLDDVFAQKYEHSLEEQAVKMIMKGISTDFYTGDTTQREDYLYALLKLRWVKKQSPRDVVLQEKLQAQIIEVANDYDFWQVLSAKKLKHEIIVNTYVRHCLDEFDAFNGLYAKIQKKRETVDLKNPKTDELDFFISNLAVLQGQVLRIMSMRALLKNLGYDISDEALSDIHNKLRIITDIVSTCEAIKEVMVELKGDIERVCQKAAAAHEIGLLTEDECQHLEIVTNLVLSNPRTEEIDKLASTFSESAQEPRKELGRELSKIALLTQKLANLWEKLKTFFQQCKAFLFFDDRHYEIGPRPTLPAFLEDELSKAPNL